MTGEQRAVIKKGQGHHVLKDAVTPDFTTDYLAKGARLFGRTSHLGSSLLLKRDYQ